MGSPHLISESSFGSALFFRVYEVREFDDATLFDFDHSDPLFLNRHLMEVPSRVPELIVSSNWDNMGIARANALVNFARNENQDYVAAALLGEGKKYDILSQPFDEMVIMRVVPRLFRKLS
jgi:hypothetical protein